jgi:hypothetical protein
MKEPTSESSHIPWHPAFIEALQMELQDYQDALEFHPEYQLTSEPLRIDCVIIKKAKNVIIKKNIAVIFRECNLLEYKSPDDYVSVTDFYKVYGYACLYTSFNNVPITDLTLSFIESRYPEKLLDHLKNERNYTVAETSPGIYNIKGDILPIQVIDSCKLSFDENLWLNGLSNKHDRFTIEQVGKEIHKQGKAARLAAYLYAITSANKKASKEAIKMKDVFYEVLEESGFTARMEEKYRAKGRAEEAFDIAQNMVNLGLPIETVISATRLDPEKVKVLYQR